MHLNLDPDDVIVPVAMDGAAMYISETMNAFTPSFGGKADAVHVGEVKCAPQAQAMSAKSVSWNAVALSMTDTSRGSSNRGWR